jgi:hypothetical protein
MENLSSINGKEFKKKREKCIRFNIKTIKNIKT